jgi:hypothetical protein
MWIMDGNPLGCTGNNGVAGGGVNESLDPRPSLPPCPTRRRPDPLRLHTDTPDPAGGQWTPNRATGRDHLWLTGEEVRALLPPAWRRGTTYPAPGAIVERPVRFHLLDNVRGEPDPWRRDQIGAARLTLTVTDAEQGVLSLAGVARTQAPAGERATARGYDDRLQATLQWDRTAERFGRWDLLAWAEA